MTKTEQITALTNWLTEREEDWSYLTLTVLFDRNCKTLSKDFCLSEYRLRILPKLQRRIERCESLWASAIPLGDQFVYYEKDETSFYKRLKSSSPYHIHGLLIIPRGRLFRVWDEAQQTISKRLDRDLRSLNYLSDWLIEPLRGGGVEHWLRYITKGGKPL